MSKWKKFIDFIVGDNDPERVKRREAKAMKRVTDGLEHAVKRLADTAEKHFRP